MSEANFSTKLYRRRALPIVSVLLIGCVFPLIAGWAVIRFCMGWRWDQVAFHSCVESFGALMALGVAGFFLLRFDKKGDYRLPLICAMLVMGILDGFHAAVSPGVEFVWLHSTAQFFGGAFMALLWLPKRLTPADLTKWIPRGLIIISVLFAVISLSFPAVIPAMIQNGQFTPTAKMLNIAGGILFFVGAAFFLRRYYVAGDKSELMFL
ncbi:MAG: hypothetical protein GY869_32700, partial [Planctomycetes bacterium]|nr:hypothetical protein [Planctomycetota bacterium]